MTKIPTQLLGVAVLGCAIWVLVDKPGFLDLFEQVHSFIYLFLDALASLESGSVGRYVRHRNCGSTIFREIFFSGLKDFRP